MARLFGFWLLNACRIVYIVDEEGPIQRYGFAYGTLPEHVESGEERFLKSSLTQLEMWQIIEPLLKNLPARMQLMAELFDSGLIDARRGRCNFRHELLERFLQAEGLLLAYPAAAELGGTLRRPRFRALAPLVLGLMSDERITREILRMLADCGLLNSCLRGEYGDAAQEAGFAECREAIRASFQALDGLHLQVENVCVRERENVRVTGGVSLAPHIVTGLRAVGSLLTTEMFLSHALALAQQTDDACRTALERVTGQPPTRALLNSLYHNLFIASQDSQKLLLPSAVIYQGAHFNRHEDASAVLANVLRDMGNTLSARSPGELFLLCKLLQSHVAAAPMLVPELLRTCWASGLYHLRLEALQVAEWGAAILTGNTRDEVQNILAVLRPRNIFLSTAVIEAMLRYDMVQSPVSEEDAATEMAELLQRPNSSDARVNAYHVVGKIFEEIFIPYYSAFQALGSNDRVRFLTMAALGASADGWDVDWILGELLREGAPESRPAFQRWAAIPSSSAFSSQQATACFLAGMMGYARFFGCMPDLGGLETDDHTAWAIYGEIIFWLFKPGLPKDQLRQVCAPHWYRLQTEVPFQAVDPLERILSTGKTWPPNENTVLATLPHVFPDDMRCVLEFGLKNHGRLTSIFGHPPFNGYLGFLINSLELLGNRQTVPLLEAFLEISEVGESAAQAIRAIRSR